jgi:hypothetical protein
MTKNRSHTDYLFDRVTTRLRQPDSWYPLPLLISFGLVLLFTNHVVLGPNPRIGSPADTIIYPSKEHHAAGIWLSVASASGNIVVTAEGHKAFSWPLNISDMQPLQGLVEYLKATTREFVYSAAISGRVYGDQSLVILAVDQHLNFVHIRPILYALAEAKIARYAFETRLPAHEKGQDRG